MGLELVGWVMGFSVRWVSGVAGWMDGGRLVGRVE